MAGKLDPAVKALLDVSVKALKEQQKTNQLIEQSSKRSKEDENSDKKDEALKAITRVTQWYSNGMGSILSKQRINYELARQNPFTAKVYGGLAHGIQQQDDLQTRMGGMGRNLRAFKPSQSLMARGLGGFQTQLEAQAEFAFAGFKAIGQPMRDLAAGMKLTGQDQNKLIQALRQANIIGGVSVEGTSRLSMTLDKTTKEYGVKTEALIDSMGDLQDSMTTNLLGTSEALDTALIELTGKYGAGSGELLRELAMQMIDMDNRGALLLAGIDEQGRLLADSNTTSEEMVALLDQSIVKLAGMSQNLTRSGYDDRIGLGISNNLLKQIGGIAASLNSIDKNQAYNVKLATDFNENLEAFKSELVSPIHELVYDVFGDQQSQMVALLKKLEPLLVSFAAITTMGSVMKMTLIAKSGVEGLKELGTLASLRAFMDLPPGALGESKAPVGEAVAVAKKGVGQVVSGKAVEGAALATATRTGGGILGASLPWVAGIGAVIGAGWLLSTWLDKKENEAQEKLKNQLNDLQTNIEQRKNALRANVSTGFSNISRASGNTAFEVTNINIQREQTKLMSDMIRELKKANGKTQGSSVRESGI